MEQAEYHKLLMSRLKEQRERRSESLAKVSPHHTPRRKLVLAYNIDLPERPSTAIADVVCRHDAAGVRKFLVRCRWLSMRFASLVQKRALRQASEASKGE